ncbi:4-hydroxy-3-methylbut-2-enyl diphosphate reductase [Carboxydochorda subterranea]|uniref:4-hydroxy-3-methylbut-2-enyl diphosphate reductase n=1 Tax=Carboxydichorda subterranea TaxID=3109565 RepID=A0ABZ1BYV2_9FIRM|nr:4-hydroxy-3-methylbut-2-enyl diphosphate reductase [Limnochorda sp. L945t]WRP17671.1 4-hydroxy-3-methylbut-2-enyl diphosphate reductase [Limnochorda sp. L945t]
MEVVPISPRGYCYGVVDALKLARAAARDPSVPRPIHVLGLLVHNRHAVEELERFGIRSLDGPDRLALLESIDRGTVILTAHGVAPAVKARARARGLHVVDATCPDVTRTHQLVKDLAARGYFIVYIGKRGHPEPEGVVGEAPGAIVLVEREEEVDGLEVPSGRPVAVTTQTTLSQWDTQVIIRRIQQRFPRAEVYNEICLATQLRQQAAVREAARVDLVIVVGDRRSNNSGRLVQVVREKAGKPAYLVEDVAGIRPEWLAGARRVGVTAGSSTPSGITREVIRWLQAYEPPAPAAAAVRPGSGTAPHPVG